MPGNRTAGRPPNKNQPGLPSGSGSRPADIATRRRARAARGITTKLKPLLLPVREPRAMPAAAAGRSCVARAECFEHRRASPRIAGAPRGRRRRPGERRAACRPGRAAAPSARCPTSSRTRSARGAARGRRVRRERVERRLGRGSEPDQGGRAVAARRGREATRRQRDGPKRPGRRHPAATASVALDESPSSSKRLRRRRSTACPRRRRRTTAGTGGSARPASPSARRDAIPTAAANICDVWEGNVRPHERRDALRAADLVARVFRALLRGPVPRHRGPRRRRRRGRHVSRWLAGEFALRGRRRVAERRPR